MSLIAKSKKTDKVDAVVLTDMHRGGYIASCYVPDVKTSDERKLVRHRSGLEYMLTLSFHLAWRTAPCSDIYRRTLFREQ